jgi:hypothetical protein
MKRVTTIVSLFLLPAVCGWALPTVDGKVSSGEYGRSLSLLYGDATVWYQADPEGGLYLAVSAPTTGWVGIGLGSVVMDGAHIFMGYVKDGVPVFSEQVGSGHSHAPSPAAFADRSAVGQEGGVTTIELHVPGNRLPRSGSRVPFIVAFAGSADLTTFHEDNHDGGMIDLSDQ